MTSLYAHICCPFIPQQFRVSQRVVRLWLWFRQIVLRHGKRCDTVQVVSRWFLTSKDRVCYKSSPCLCCSGHWNTSYIFYTLGCKFFLRKLHVYLLIIHRMNSRRTGQRSYIINIPRRKETKVKGVERKREFVKIGVAKKKKHVCIELCSVFLFKTVSGLFVFLNSFWCNKPKKYNECEVLAGALHSLCKNACTCRYVCKYAYIHIYVRIYTHSVYINLCVYIGLYS